MKKLSVAVLLTLGVSLPYSAMAADDDVTIRMMDMNETAYENVMKEIELPESASDNGRENSAKGLANANERRALNRERKAERDLLKEERKAERDALKEERKAERDALKEERDAMMDDMDDMDDMSEARENEDRLTGQDRAADVRSNNK